MEGTRIVLVRHGESLAQQNRVVGGHEGCTGLSDLGRRQVGALRERLATTKELAPVAALYSSVMPRARETAEILSDALGAVEITQECDFCEAHPGEIDGMGWDEVQERYPGPTDWDPHYRRVPDAETFVEMGERVARGLDALVERHPGETVVVACHGGVILHSMVRWLGLSSGVGRSRAWLDADNASMTEWRFGSHPWDVATSGIQLVRFNDHAHLAAQS